MTRKPMNLPNRITMIRMLLIPVFLVFMSIEGTATMWIAAAIFSIAAVTDMLDGMLARRRNEVTDFGKFMDPIADKLLVLMPMMLQAAKGGEHLSWAVMLMVAREIIVSGFRLVAVRKGKVIAAGITGKVKTIVQMAAVLLLTLNVPLSGVVIWVATALSIYSGVEILWKNRSFLEETE